MERRLFKPLSEWSVDDVRALIDERIPEGQRLDYKEALPLAADKDRAELAKDASGFANAQGGLLIYGVAEDESEEPRPVELKPLPSDGQQTRVEDILDSTVSPRLEYESVTLDAEGGSLLLLRVSPRAGGPHMVQGYKQHRYFARRGTRTVPMTEDEVRVAYEAARTRSDRVDQLLRALPLLPRIGRTRALDQIEMATRGIALPDEWVPFVSVVTAPFDAPAELITPALVRPEAFPQPFDRFRGRNRYLGTSGQFGIDALGLVDENLVPDADDERRKFMLNRLRLYRSGVCEWAHRYEIPGARQAIPSTSFAEDVHNALAYFASVYETVGYFGRLGAYVRIDDAEDAALVVNPSLTDFPRDTKPEVEWVGAYRETTVDALLADPVRLVRDTLEVIWQAFGYRQCLLFDADGNWLLNS